MQFSGQPLCRPTPRPALPQRRQAWPGFALAVALIHRIRRFCQLHCDERWEPVDQITARTCIASGESAETKKSARFNSSEESRAPVRWSVHFHSLIIASRPSELPRSQPLGRFDPRPQVKPVLGSSSKKSFSFASRNGDPAKRVVKFACAFRLRRTANWATCAGLPGGAFPEKWAASEFSRDLLPHAFFHSTNPDDNSLFRRVGYRCRSRLAWPIDVASPFSTA